jgi:glycosyltransferase involved in cell wall biosynthesis
LSSRDPLPIVLVFGAFDPGGTERQMIELVRRLDRDRWSVHIACLRATGGWRQRAAEGAASVVEFPVTSFRKWSAVRQAADFAAWCRERRILVVHATTLPTNVFALPAAALARVPVRVANRREINPDKTAAEIGLQRMAYGFAHRIVANSRAAAKRLAVEWVPARKVSVVPNGLDAGAFAATRPRRSPRRVVVVANLRAEKGHDVLIDAAVEVLRHFPDARFDVVGDGPERASLLAHASARGVLSAFSFAGHCEEVAARLADADLFVLPSRSEAFPNAVLEGMASGLTVVASAVGGVPELIEDGRTGVLVPPGDPAVLADRLVSLMHDASRAHQLGAAAAAHVRAHYSFERMVEAFEGIYLSELARRGIERAAQLQLAAS